MANDIINALGKGTLLTSARRTYRIEDVLGAGGFGITYLVSSEIMVDNVPVVTYFALKEHFIKKVCERRDSMVCSTSNNSKDVEQSRENFLSEARRLNKLSASHNNIVKVNESFSANETAYYVMEYIDGPSLRTVIKSNGNKPLTWEEAMKIIKPIADAVSYLHDNRLTHLDIKPDNIILDTKKNNRPVLIDFGLSKHYDKKGEATSTIRITGCSDGYSPVEQYVGITSFSPRSDMYALAATLLFLLTGKDPVVATELTAEKIKNSLEKRVPESVLPGIIKALSRQPEDRFGSIKEFINTISSPMVTADPDNPRTEHTTNNEATVRLDNNKPKKKKIVKIAAAICSVIALIFIGYFGFSYLFDGSYLKLPDGSRFYGQLDDEGNPHGKGRLIDTSGKEFEGSWKNGEFVTGILRTPEYEYEGTFENMIPSGYGSAVYLDGRKYVGHWEAGEWNGLGKFTSENGDIRFGLFVKGNLSNPQPFTIGEKVYGIDVSKWQRQIKWKELYLPADENGIVSTAGGDYMQPVLYAVIKATDGTDVDDYYDRNYINAKQCGITCGAYHFLTTKKSVDEQVKGFIETAHLEEGDLPPILDLELPHDVMMNNRKEICDMALSWLDKIESHYGVRPLIYTYYSFIRDYLTDPRFDNYDYFIAYHRSELPNVKNWIFWQFSENVRTPAIPDNSVDTDIFKGDYSEFQKYLKRNGIKQIKEGD